MYAKHGNLVDADASGAKASTKHLESHLEIIQGDAFLDYWKKSTRDCVLLYINVALESEIWMIGLSISVFENPAVIRRPPV